MRPVAWQVLVVDNNSNDRTRQVVEEFCSLYPGRFCYLFEATPGKSHALNAGVREARSDILAFTDDDVIVEPTWLSNLTASLREEKYAGAGGRIILDWPSSVPSWMSIEGSYARHPFPGFDHGQVAKELTGPPFGANMAFRKSAFEKHGLFRTDLGPSPDPSIPPHSEDTEFGRRLITAGEKLRYEATAVVHHPVSNDRIDKRYFLSWHFDLGRADVRIASTRGDRGMSLHFLGSLAMWLLRWMVAIEPRVRFYCKLIVWQKAGALVEYWRGRSSNYLGRLPSACRSDIGSPPTDLA